MNEAFKRMKVVLSEALIKNLFVVLDQNNDDSISMQEFQAVFSKYFSDDK